MFYNGSNLFEEVLKIAKIFDYKESNLLVRSQYLKNSSEEEFNLLFTILLEKRNNNENMNVYTSEICNDSFIENLTKNKQAILKFCRDEWKYDKEIRPFVKRFDEEQICQLCGNATVKTYHYVRNEHTLEKLAIGKDCASIMMNSEETLLTKHYSSDPVLFERFNEILKNQVLKNILHKQEINYYRYPHFPIVLKRSWITKINKIMKSVIDRVRLLVEDLTIEANQVINDSEIVELIEEYKIFDKHLNDFSEDNKKSISYLNKDLLDSLSAGTKEKEDIVKSVEKNNGILAGDIASRINNENFLLKFLKEYNKLAKDLEILNVRFEINQFKYVIQFKRDAPLTILVRTNKFLTIFGNCVFDRNEEYLPFDKQLLTVRESIEYDSEDDRGIIEMIGLNKLDKQFRLIINNSYLENTYLDKGKGDKFEAVVHNLISDYYLFERKNGSEILLIPNRYIFYMGLSIYFDLDVGMVSHDLSAAKRYDNAGELRSALLDLESLTGRNYSSQQEFY